MSAEVESMFYTRETPWHGLGTRIDIAPDSKEALKAAGLDWMVVQRDLFTENNMLIHGFKANVRESDENFLGIVSNKYRIVQNQEAFAFTDALLNEGVRYETAGSLANGKQVWLLARLPQKYIVKEDEIAPYLVFLNSHDGSGSVRVAITPIRVVCKNTLNLALKKAKRSWSTRHIGNIKDKMHEAKHTLFMAENYMTELAKSIDELSDIHLSDVKVISMIDELFPVLPDMGDVQKMHSRKSQTELKYRYFDAPDLKDMGGNGYRFINAVSDMASHGRPLRETKNYRENNFKRIVEGNAMIDKAYRMVLAAV